VDDAPESLPSGSCEIEADVKELLGLFDVPAFARRGLELDFMLRRMHDRCSRARDRLLDMVRVRLRQWSAAVTGPDAWSLVFARSIEPLWLLAGAEPPRWARTTVPVRRQRLIAHDLTSSVLRFNRRWIHFLDHLNLDPANDAIDRYNRYYVLEKECVVGSARLAAQHFTPVPRLSTQMLLDDHPVLPVPEPLDQPSRQVRDSTALEPREEM
jgi:hypothetical protein